MLWGDDGKPLGLVEAKRTRRDPRAGQQQAKLYADCLERQFGRRPVIFYSNGYEHWIWDDTDATRRARSRASTRRTSWSCSSSARRAASHSRRPRSTARSSSATTRRAPFAGSPRVVREATANARRCSSWPQAPGKTRTVIALSDLLMRCQLGQARAVPGRSRRARESGGRTRSSATCRTRRR